MFFHIKPVEKKLRKKKNNFKFKFYTIRQMFIINNF